MTKTMPAKKTRTSAAPARSSKAAPAAKKLPAAAPPARKAAPPRERPAAPEPAVAKPKHKLVRDSFTIPKSEYVVLEALKLRAAKLERPTKKSEVLRAGIAALNAMSDKAFLAAILAIPSIKTGRPKGPAKSAT
jgi:hypothetical protein